MRSDRATSIFWLIFGFLLIEESCQLKLGELRKPDSGLYPFLIGISMVLFSFIMLLQTFSNKTEKEEKKERLNYRNIILCVVSLYAYTLIFEWLGFILSTYFLIIFLLKFVEKKGWGLVITTAFLTAIVSYVLFEICLQATLPKGIFGI